MSLIEKKCIEYNERRKICIASEKSKKYELTNKSNFIVRKIKVDQCFTPMNNKKRCDFLMDVKEFKTVFFIELKGGDLVEAIKQIHSTILYLKEEFKDYTFNARIVGSRDVLYFINTPHYLNLAKEITPKGTIKRATNFILKENI